MAEPGPTAGRFPEQADIMATAIVAVATEAVATERIRKGKAREFTKCIGPSVQTPSVRRGC